MKVTIYSKNVRLFDRFMDKNSPTTVVISVFLLTMRIHSLTLLRWLKSNRLTNTTTMVEEERKRKRKKNTLITTCRRLFPDLFLSKFNTRNIPFARWKYTWNHTNIQLIIQLQRQTNRKHPKLIEIIHIHKNTCGFINTSIEWILV